MKKKLTVLTLSALIAANPSFCDAPPPPPQETWLALCVVAVAGLAVTTIYIVSKRCQPKYYWLMDNNVPPTYWVGTATRKECEINEWKRIGGPYNRPQDAPMDHPDPTNRVETASSAPLKIATQSFNGTNWITVDQQVCDLDDFIYFPTNAAMFRLEVGVP